MLLYWEELKELAAVWWWCTAGADLNVAAAHVMLVALQSQVSGLWVDEADQGLAIPPTLGVQTESHATPTHTQRHSQSPLFLQTEILPVTQQSMSVRMKRGTPTWQC